MKVKVELWNYNLILGLLEKVQQEGRVDLNNAGIIKYFWALFWYESYLNV